MEELPLTLTWGEGDDTGSWLPSEAQGDGLLITKLAAGGFEEADVPASAHQLLELAGIEGIPVLCPACKAEIQYVLMSRPTESGGEEWYTRPCPLCAASTVVTVLPKRAVELRRRIEALRAKGDKRSLTPAEVSRLQSLAKQYQRVMAKT